MMKRTFLLIAITSILALAVTTTTWAESYAEYLEKLRKAETPKLIPKGGLQPKLLSTKDIIIETTKTDGKVNTSEALLFEYGLPVLRPIPRNDENLKIIAHGIKIGYEKFPDFTYYIDGHTCDIGSDDHNCRLSYERAQTVFKELVKRGVSEEKLEIRGFGEKDVEVPNTSEENRRLNRRVVILTGGEKASEMETMVCRSTSGSGKPNASSPAVSDEMSGDLDMADQLEKVAEQNRLHAEKAEASGDSKLAKDLRAAADALEQAALAEKRMIGKGKPKTPEGILPGFKPK